MPTNAVNKYPKFRFTDKHSNRYLFKLNRGYIRSNSEARISDAARNFAMKMLELDRNAFLN
jgi:hypothetical protein